MESMPANMLASAGIKVVLTTRDEQRGLQALETLKASGLSHSVVLHQLDVADAASVATLANFVKSQFGKLDILVNNDGIGGVEIKDGNLFNSALITNGCVSNEWAKGVFSYDENLSEERIDEVLKEFIKDFEQGSLERKGWPRYLATYTVAKASMNAYTRIIAKKYPNFCINCVCPGYVKTDITANIGFFTAKEGVAHPARLALLPNGNPFGLYYIQNEVSSF
ncbi:hypothetical protein KIW84_045176 [Lathyrus oleraceus]|uniref:(+)-neomenthol dehydrogenase-like n=1 Tax=Pisum sativum TaxID=3888 RepID=A0A9D4XID6_PEA|nr:hypothetical protein KIW84_045176 [Pisum sativum]